MDRSHIYVDNKQVFLARVRNQIETVGRPVRLLEAGFGVGGVTEHVLAMLRPDDTYVGVDINPENLPVVAELIPPDRAARCQLLIEDMCAMTRVADASIDVVISDTAINLVHWRLRQAFAEFRRALRPGGTVVLRELQPTDPQGLTKRDAFFRTLIAARLLTGLPYLMVPVHAVETALTDAGFEDVHTEHAVGQDPPGSSPRWYYPFGEPDFGLSDVLLEHYEEQARTLPDGGALSSSYTITATAGENRG